MSKFVRNPSVADRRFALVIGLGVTLCAGRVLLLFAMRGLEPTSRLHFPLFFRYDAALLLLIAWLTCSPQLSSATIARFRGAALWSIASLLVVVTAINLVVYRELRVPATYRLLVISDNLRGLHGAVGETLGMVIGFTAAAFLLMGSVAAVARCVPNLLARVRRAFFSWPVTLVLVVVLGVTESRARQDQYPGVAASPLWTLVASVPDLNLPFLPAGRSNTADFLPPNAPALRSIGPLALTRHHQRGRPTNVLMVVLESVGAKWLGIYGAPHQNSTQIERLAERGAVFSRVYASAPNSSSAMASLFSSVYPFHGRQTLSRVYPDLRIPGLPHLLASRGYRTALIHGGSLEYDNNGNFLKHQGFGELFDDPTTARLSTNSDVGTLAQALWWLDKNAAQPFFLTVWTNQTHFPYHDDQSVAFGTGNARLERYLNGILAGDRMIGELVRGLDRLGVASDTIVIVTGDHGETFGLHGKFAHGFEIYEEEMWTPLVIVAPSVPRQTVLTPVRQIDLPPTILGMLGYPVPVEWQGVDLTRHTPPPRAYLFTGWTDLTFGLIENERKSIFHFPDGTSELYDLRADPSERRDLAGSDAGRAELGRSRQRIDDWIRFQNTYLATFAGRSRTVRER